MNIYRYTHIHINTINNYPAVCSSLETVQTLGSDWVSRLGIDQETCWKMWRGQLTRAKVSANNGGSPGIFRPGLEPIPCWKPCIFCLRASDLFWRAATMAPALLAWTALVAAWGCLELDATALTWFLQFSNLLKFWSHCSVLLRLLAKAAPLVVNQEIVRDQFPFVNWTWKTDSK